MAQARLVDSDVLIDWLRGHSAALDLLHQSLISEQKLYVSVVSRIEVLAGARRNEFDDTVRQLDLFADLTIDRIVGDRAASLSKDYAKSHSGIGLPDYIIAATALEHNLELLTRNLKHYPMIKGLKAAY